MAPASKKAKTAAAGSGKLSLFFGSKTDDSQAPSSESPSNDANMSESNSPPKSEAPTETTAAALPAAGLSDEQKRRIEENRQKALERKRARESGVPIPIATPARAPTPPSAAVSQELPVAAAAPPSAPPAATPPAPPAAPPAAPVAAPEPKAKAKAKGKAGAKAKPKAAANETPSEPVEQAVSPTKPPGSATGTETTPEKLSQSSRRIPSASQDTQPSCKFDRLPNTTWQQYNHLYQCRLNQLSGPALETARSLWSGVVPSNGFLKEITSYRKGTEGSEVVLVGVLFKDLKKRANVVEEFRSSKGLSGMLKDDQLEVGSLYSDDDVLWLEDSSMRIQLLMSDELKASLATGFVIAVKGSATKAGTFKVSGFCFPAMPQTAEVQMSADSSNGPFMALMSGLAFGSDDVTLKEARSRAIDFLCRESQVQEVVVCGGLFAAEKALGAGGLKEALKQIDEELSSLVDTKNSVQVMPGKGEPTNSSMPQMSLHRQLFRSLRSKSSFRPVSNPTMFTADALEVLGHSGQPVEDLLRSARLEPLGALKMCLEARHLAPTAPDTLATEPFADVDPFILDSAPHVLFSGGHSKEAFEWAQSGSSLNGTQCVCVPAFHQRPAIILINLKNPKEVKVQEFTAVQA